MDADEVVINFPQKVDTKYCQAGAAGITEKVAVASKVEFDLQDVVYICSSFLRICLQVAKEKGRDSFKVTHCGPETMKVFKIAGYDGIMDIS